MGNTAANVATGGLTGMVNGIQHGNIAGAVTAPIRAIDPVAGHFAYNTTNGMNDHLGIGSSPHAPTPVAMPGQITMGTPNLYKPYDQYMPSSYFNNAPITDPSAILAAYQKYMPQFLQASRPTPI